MLKVAIGSVSQVAIGSVSQVVEHLPVCLKFIVQPFEGLASTSDFDHFCQH